MDASPPNPGMPPDQARPPAHPQGFGAVNAAERAELHRQGAKAAARGDEARDNPLRRSVNRPRLTGEEPSTWLLRLQAWARGFHGSEASTASAGPRTRRDPPRQR